MEDEPLEIKISVRLSAPEAMCIRAVADRLQEMSGQKTTMSDAIRKLIAFAMKYQDGVLPNV